MCGRDVMSKATGDKAIGTSSEGPLEVELTHRPVSVSVGQQISPCPPDLARRFVLGREAVMPLHSHGHTILQGRIFDVREPRICSPTAR